MSAILYSCFFGLVATSSQDVSISYSPTYFSSPIMAMANTSRIFSSYFDDNTHISSFNDLGECKNECLNNSLCLGIVETQNPDISCVLLDTLGKPISTNITSVSLTKTTYYDHREKHSISGYYYYANPSYGEDTVHTVYLDLNYNGVWDSTEPINTTINNNFEFSNVSSGNYLVRDIQDDQCVQIWPGGWGHSTIESYNADTYVDSIVQYYHSGHSSKVIFSGGHISDKANNIFHPLPEAPSSFILGNTPSTFLSFKPNDGIILAFLDELIVASNNASDIIIDTFGDSDTKAYVSVSQDNLQYTFIGVLENGITGFNLSAVNYTKHVGFIKMDFFNEDNANDVAINIISVRGTAHSSYYSPFSVYVSVPQKRRVVFVKDCNYYYKCHIYCIFSHLTSDEKDSCLVGCDLWDKTGTCMCEDYSKNNILFEGDVFLKDVCEDGCIYRIKHEVYPEYYVKMHASGLENTVTSTINCQNYDTTELSPNGCIRNIIDSCSRQPSCQAISLDNHIEGMLYNNYHYVDKENSYFIVKNTRDTQNNLVRYTTVTTTPTTTMSSTPTTSLSSTPTSTMSSTHTTSLSSTHTTSVSSTPTITMSSTPTTSVSSTPTTNTITTVTTSTTMTTVTTTINITTTSTNDITWHKTLFIILLVLLIVVLLGIIIALCFKNKNKNTNNNDVLRIHPNSYSNPIYDDTTNDINNQRYRQKPHVRGIILNSFLRFFLLL
jgi:hypothetical protein